jgi:hypothetical protein
VPSAPEPPQPTPTTLAAHAAALADAIDDVLPAWVERCVRSRLTTVSRDVVVAAREAGQRARAEVGAAVRQLLLRDIDDQKGNPLALLRTAVRYPTDVLLAAGAPIVERDKFSRERFPDDDYDLTPANWSDIHPSLQDLGITWGAAKAFEHKQRHRPTS